MELKKCPFCGGSANMHANYARKINRWFIFCKCGLCGAEGQKITSLESPGESDWRSNECERAVEAWNKRFFRGEEDL